MNKFKYTVVIISFLIGLIFTYLIFWMPNNFDGDRFITVSKGEKFRQITDSLEKNGILRSRITFLITGKILGTTTKIQIGKYRFKPGYSNKNILDILKNGSTIEQITVTIPEGFSALRQAKIFEKQLGTDHALFMQLVNDTQYAAGLGISKKSLEGYLMPSTYQLFWQMDEKDIIKRMVQTFWKVFKDTLEKRFTKQKRSLNDILTIASIVEAETAVDSERPIIAGVYYNRLYKRMNLNADPTIQYLLNDGPRKLYYSDLQIESPYNTYRHYGLPPGPINNPGTASISAAMNPKKHKYLFFVANGIGGHIFSRTYAEHQKAVRHLRKFREEQKKRAGKQY